MTHDEAKAKAEAAKLWNLLRVEGEGSIDDIAAALVAARPQWQPIETAPKDSSWLLGLMRTRRQAVVRWGGGVWEDDNRLCRDPIAWMPLPAPPVEALLAAPENQK